VISYPTKALSRLSPDLGTGLRLAEKVISGLTREAVKSGFLIRGGATVGPLYHRNGVVVGSALVEAYKLESTVSIYPRIAVSRKLYSRVRAHSALLAVDEDGITYFDYFLPMLGREAPDGSPDNKFVSETLLLINQNISIFEEQERWNEMAKWVWFLGKFDKALTELRAASPPDRGKRAEDKCGASEAL